MLMDIAVKRAPKVHLILRIILYFLLVTVVAVFITLMTFSSEEIDSLHAAFVPVGSATTAEVPDLNSHELTEDMVAALDLFLPAIQLPLAITSFFMSVIFFWFFDKSSYAKHMLSGPASASKKVLTGIVAFIIFAFLTAAVAFGLSFAGFAEFKGANLTQVSHGINCGLAVFFLFLSYPILAAMNESGIKNGIGMLIILGILINFNPTMTHYNDHTSNAFFYSVNHVMILILLALVFLRFSHIFVPIGVSLGLYGSLYFINASFVLAPSSLIGGTLLEGGAVFSLFLLIMIAAAMYLPLKNNWSVYEIVQKIKENYIQSQELQEEGVPVIIAENEDDKSEENDEIHISTSEDFSADIIVDGEKYDWKPLLKNIDDDDDDE